MKLVKLPVMIDTKQDDQGLCISLPTDKVAERLMNGNTMCEIISALKENNEDGDSDV